MNLEVRAGSIVDAKKCAEIVSDWITKTEWMPRLFSQSELVTIIEEAIPEREFWVLGHPIVGYLSFQVELSQVVALYTAIPGNGVGKVLLNKIKQRYNYIQLWSHSANKSAHRFYRREGFNHVKSMENGADGIPETQFEWGRKTIR